MSEAINRAEHGIIDADLGHGLIKQRVARPGGGRRGGYRTVIAYRNSDRAMFLFGFAKSNRANMSKDDEADLKEFGMKLLRLNALEIKMMIGGQELTEVPYDEGAE